MSSSSPRQQLAPDFDPCQLERDFQANRGKAFTPMPVPPPEKLTPSSTPPALLPTTVHLVTHGKSKFVQILQPGLAPAVGTILVFPKLQRLQVKAVALMVDESHPLQRNTYGTFYRLQCEPHIPQPAPTGATPT